MPSDTNAQINNDDQTTINKTELVSLGKKKNRYYSKYPKYKKHKNKNTTIMDPLIGAGLISAGASGINAALTSQNNRKNRRFQREMFDKTNEYNTPLKQVERMKAAGLNPALMYQGTPQNTASQVSAVKGEAYHIPENLLADIYQKITAGNLNATKTPDININLGNLQGANIAADTALKGENLETSKVTQQKIASENEAIQQKYRMNQALWNTDIDYRKEQLAKLQNDIQQQKTDLLTQPQMNAAKLQLLENSYLESVQRTRSLNNANWIQENEQKLRDLGVNPNGTNMADTVLRYLVTIGSKLLNK